MNAAHTNRRPVIALVALALVLAAFAVLLVTHTGEIGAVAAGRTTVWHHHGHVAVSMLHPAPAVEAATVILGVLSGDVLDSQTLLQLKTMGDVAMVI
jgi:hypothetical protein